MKKHLQEVWQNSLASIDKNIKKDIYAFSFYIYNHEDDLRSPVLTIGYNTLSNLQKKVNEGAGKQEAKWNYAYWLQNEMIRFGGDEDNEGKAKIDNWTSELGLTYSDKEFDEDFDTCYEKGEKITEHFINILIETVKESHLSGITTKPIIIHELEYYDEIRDQNITANGAKKVQEFSDWINKM